MIPKTTNRRDIDSGWAWVVLVAVYLGMVIYCFLLYMSGILYIALLDRYGESETKTSLVGAISTGLLCFLGPFAGGLNNKFSCRFSIVIGGFLTSVGCCVSAFASSLDVIIVTAGVLVGAGFGIASSGLICVLGFYFERWRNLTLSCAFLVVGFAMFLSAPVGLYLVETFGLTQTFFILAAAELQLCVIGAVCRPSAIELDVQRRKRVDRENRTQSVLKSYIDFSLTKNFSYLFFLVSTAAWNFALTVAIIHLPNYVTKLGGGSRNIGIIMTVFSIANLIGRGLGSITISKFNKKAIIVHSAALGVSGILTAFFIFYSMVPWGVYIFTVQLGVCTGWPNSMMTPLSLSFVGLDKLSEANGLAYLFCGIGVTVGPILIGYLYSILGTYEASFITAGLVLVIGSIFGFVSRCIRGQSRALTNTILIEDETHNPMEKTTKKKTQVVFVKTGWIRLDILTIR